MPISQAAIGVQFLYVIMMYISVYPVVITMRHSNVYEERSLGIYQDEPPQEDARPSSSDGSSLVRRPTAARRLSQSIPAGDISRSIQRSLTAWNGVGVPTRHKKRTGVLARAPVDNRINFVRQQVHGQLAHDLWWLVLAALVITMIETSHFNKDPVVFSIFNVIFEVVSAYGTVGISVGLPNAAYSFCGAWHTASKLVLCLVMLRGRHRGLPVALDHAVRLPGEHLHREEEEDHRIRRSISERRT